MSRSYRSAITAQSSQAGTAGTMVTSGQTVINCNSGENAEGAEEFQFELNVTSAPSTATYVQLYYAESQDGTNYSEYKQYGAWISVGTSAARYVITAPATSPYIKTGWLSPSYNLTATLTATPVYYA